MDNNIQLELKNITTVYGNNKMLLDVSLQIPKGECVCLLGSNGAGKSTLIKSVLGLVKIVEGSVLYKGNDITGQKTYKTVRQGISIVPEGKRIFIPIGNIRELVAFLKCLKVNTMLLVLAILPHQFLQH